jgi:hypothetical protein
MWRRIVSNALAAAVEGAGEDAAEGPRRAMGQWSHISTRHRATRDTHRCFGTMPA